MLRISCWPQLTRCLKLLWPATRSWTSYSESHKQDVSARKCPPGINKSSHLIWKPEADSAWQEKSISIQKTEALTPPPYPWPGARPIPATVWTRLWMLNESISLPRATAWSTQSSKFSIHYFGKHGFSRKNKVIINKQNFRSKHILSLNKGSGYL